MLRGNNLILTEAQADVSTRTRWTDRLYQAVLEDELEYLAEVQTAWGDICGFPELANRWADTLLAPMRDCWTKTGQGSNEFKGAAICLSSLVKAGRYTELEEVLSLHPQRSWYFERFSAEALARQGRVDDAVARAEACLRRDNKPVRTIHQFCERILLQAGRRDEAQRYHRA